MRLNKLIAGAGASALTAAVVLLGAPGAAHAQQALEVTPNANLSGGDTIDVVATGLPPNTSVAIGICQKGRPAEGPGDCAAAKDGHAVLEVSDDDGRASATLVVVEGPSGNTAGEPYDCGANDPCVVSAAAISGDGEAITVDLNYAAAAEAAASDEPADTDDAAAAPVDATAADELSETGPRETLITALVGLALLQLGLVLAVRAVRSVPRRTAA